MFKLRRSKYHTSRNVSRSQVFYDDGTISGTPGHGILWQGKALSTRWKSEELAKACLDEMHKNVRGETRVQSA